MTPINQMQRQREESERLLAWNRAETIKQLQDSVGKLTHEQIWDLENEHKFDPAIFRSIQAETSQ